MVETDVFKLKLLNFCISASRLYILLKLLQFISSMQMKLSSSSLSTHSTLTQAFLTFKTLFNTSVLGWLLSADLLTFNSSKTEFLLIGLKNQLAKIQNSSLDTSHSAHNLGFILASSLTNILRYFLLPNYISLSKACYYHIRQLRCSWRSALITITKL